MRGVIALAALAGVATSRYAPTPTRDCEAVEARCKQTSQQIFMSAGGASSYEQRPLGAELGAPWLMALFRTRDSGAAFSALYSYVDAGNYELCVRPHGFVEQGDPVLAHFQIA